MAYASPLTDLRPSPPPRPVTSSSQPVRLLDVDADLGAGLSPDDRLQARRAVVAETRSLPRGLWRPDARLAAGGRASAIVVLSGTIIREIDLAGRRAAELLGPGDAIPPEAPDDRLVPSDISWHVHEDAAVALLDARFALACRRWPSIAARLQERLLARSERLAVQLAIAQLPRVEQRVLAQLWHLAERWGRVTPAGVVVPLRLTHERLGQLVGARRPTVTLAVAELAEAGHVERLATGTWRLAPSSLDALRDAGATRAL